MTPTRTRWRALMIGLIAIGLTIGEASAQAATITVTTENDLFGVGLTGCSLRWAINPANNNSEFNGCIGVMATTRSSSRRG